MSDILSSRSIGILASLQLADGLSLEQVAASIGDGGDAFWRFQGWMRKRYPDIVGSVDRLSNRVEWSTAVLIRCEQEFEGWVFDPFAPLDYLALALAHGQRTGPTEPNSLWHWPSAIRTATGLDAPPSGVRMLPLASDSMLDIIRHLEGGLLRHIERLGPEDPETLTFQSRRDILEATLGFRLTDKLQPKVSNALRAFDERTGYRAIVYRMIDELPESVPETLRHFLRSGVSLHEAELEQNRRQAVFRWNTNIATTSYRSPHESSWW